MIFHILVYHKVPRVTKEIVDTSVCGMSPGGIWLRVPSRNAGEDFRTLLRLEDCEVAIGKMRGAPICIMYSCIYSVYVYMRLYVCIASNVSAYIFIFSLHICICTSCISEFIYVIYLLIYSCN